MHFRAPLSIGVDLDGVLGDQVTAILPTVLEQTGVVLTFDEVTAWDLPLGAIGLAEILSEAMGDAAFLDEVAPYPGAAQAMARLGERHKVVVVTARTPSVEDPTRQWLQRMGIPNAGLICAGPSKKSVFGLDVLIDDYDQNVRHFVLETEGLGFLVTRPWNSRIDLSDVEATGRFYRVKDLEEAANVLDEVVTP